MDTSTSLTQSGVATYGAIMADFPHRYQNFSKAKNGAVAAHYETMSYEGGVALKPTIQALAKKDCHLFYWATGPKLDQCIDMVKAWGFDYITYIPWVKVTPSAGTIRRGIGFWAMQASELLLICRKGKPKRRNVNGGTDKPIGLLKDGEAEERVFYAPIGKHSAKPLEIHEYVEKYVEGPYLELFATRPREGWTTIGHSLGTWISERGVETLEERDEAMSAPPKKLEKLRTALAGIYPSDSPELNALADKVVEEQARMRNEPLDINEWAHRLAEDVVSLTD